MALTQTELRLLDDGARRFADAAASLANPAMSGHSPDRARLGREIGLMQPVMDAHEAWRVLETERLDLERTASGEDFDLAGLADEELRGIAVRQVALETRIRALLEESLSDPADDRGVILEVRAGTGGEEAALFAAELLRMYLRHAERRGWSAQLLDCSRTDRGGVREAVVSIDGRGVWRWLRHEGGVHRVQRVPVTEAQGRIHTSAAAVSVLAAADEAQVDIKPSDLRIDTFCSSGAGRQSVNTTYSAVRIVHVPTGIVAQCQDERSQAKNKTRAMTVLRARLLAREEELRSARDGEARRAQVRSADRSEKIRTYHFPQNRVTDHRVNVSLHRLRDVLDGDLGELQTALDRASRTGTASMPDPARLA